MPFCISRPFRPVVLVLALLAAGCGGSRDSAEEHRRLSLRVEHQPPRRVVAGEEAEIRAIIRSSLEAPRLEAWVRVIQDDGTEDRIPLRITETGEAIGRLPAAPRGTVIRYVVEARDAAGLVVALPRGARDGRTYMLRYEGASSRLLGGLSWISALAGVLLFLGAGAASVQTLRGRMSVGPAGMLGAFGALAVILGLLVLGGIHAFQVTGRPWPSTPILLAVTRGELAVVAAIWVGNLVLGRRLLLDESPSELPTGQRGFAVAGAVAGGLTVLFALI